MYGDYSYQIYQLLQQYLPGISTALSNIYTYVMSIHSAIQTHYADVIAFCDSYKVYIIGLLFLTLLGYIYGRRNLL